MSKKGKSRITPKQAKLVKALASGATQKEAALEAGYSENNPDQSAYQAIRQLGRRVPALMDRLGLSEEALIQKNLVPLLEARETRFFAYRKQTSRTPRATKKNPTPAPIVETVQVIDSREVDALGIRTAALDIAFRLHGSYAPKQIDLDPDESEGYDVIDVSAIPRHG